MQSGSSRIKVSIVGCGAITEQSYLPTLSKIPDFEIVSLLDLNVERARMLAQRYGIRRYGRAIDDMPSDTEAAVVALPNNLHSSVSCELMNKGLHVFCEKPMAITKSEAEMMVQCSKENNVRLGIGNVFRFYWTSNRVRDIVQSKQLGDLVSFHIEEGHIHDWPTLSGFFFDRTKSGGGVLVDMGAHILDLLLWWLQDFPREIHYQDDNFGGVEAECYLTLSFGASIQGSIKLSRLAKLQNKYTLNFTRGALSFQPYDPSGVCNAITVFQGHREKLLKAKPPRTYLDYFKKQLRDFYGNIRQGTPSIAAPESILPSIQLIERCYQTASRLALPWIYNGGSPNIKSHKSAKSVDLEGQKILITGASGFIGTRTATRLYLDHGNIARCLVKNFNKVARLSNFPTEVVVGDVLDYDSLEKVTADVDVVIHCAYGNTPDDALNTKINTLGTENIIKASLKNGVKRFIHLSTIEVYGKDQPSIVDEGTKPKTSDNSYGNSKLEAENICLRYFRESSLPLVILRLAVVYGPYAPISTVAVVSRLLNQGFCLSSAFNGFCNPVYIDDCVDAIFAALAKEDVLGEIFLVSGGEKITWNEYFSRYNQILAMPPLKYASRVQLRTYGLLRKAFDLLYNRVQPKYGNDVFITYSRLRERKHIPNLKSLLQKGSLMDALPVYSRQAYYSIDKAKARLDFEPKYNFDKGMEMLRQWLLHTSQARP